jgi:large subunit ribosomal protein L17
MRHRKSGRKLGRTSTHRRALFRNMVTSLLEHERITTTEAKAKELRRHADKTISKSIRVQDIVKKDADDRTVAEKAKLVHAMRMAGRMVRDRDVLGKLFNELAPKLQQRPGGYTRIVKIGPRAGDSAPMALIELVL